MAENVTIPSWVYTQMGLPVPQQPVLGNTQPGLGIPTSALPSEMPDEFEMDPMYVGQDADEIEMEPDYVGKSLAGAQEPTSSSVQVPGSGTTGAPGQPVQPRSEAPVVSGQVDAISGVDAPPVISPPQPQPHTPPPPTEEDLQVAFDRSFTRVLDDAVSPVENPGKAYSTDELELQGQLAQDQAVKLRISAAKADAMMKAEEARRSAPSLIEFEAETRRITAEKEQELRNYIAEVRRGYEEAAQAARQADDAFPDPDDLLGGSGSWSRSLGLALAAAYAGHPGSTVALAIDQQLRLGTASAEARYRKFKARAESLTDITGKKAGSIKDVAAGYDAMLDAGKQRLAARLQVIANNMAPGKAQTALLVATANILETNVRGRYDRAKTIADIREKEAQAQKELALAAKARGQLGGTGGAGVNGDPSKGFYNPFDGSFVPFPDGVKYDAKVRAEIRDVNIAYTDYNKALNQLKQLVGEVKRRKLAGTLTDGWKTSAERQYQTIASKVAYLEAKTVDPTSTVRSSELEEFRKNLPMPSSLFGNEWDAADDVYATLNDYATSKYVTYIKGHGLNPTSVVKSADDNRPQSTSFKSGPEIRVSAAGDYVPGKAPDISIPTKAVDEYIDNFYDVNFGRVGTDKRQGPTGEAADKELVTELKQMYAKQVSNLDKAREYLRKNPKSAEAKKTVSNYQFILKDMDRRIKDVESGQERKRREQLESQKRLNKRVNEDTTKQGYKDINEQMKRELGKK